MKKFKTCFIVLLIFMSCQKEKNEVEIFLPGNQQYGFMQATKSASDSNSGVWNASGWAALDSTFCCNKIAIGATTYDDFDQRRESLIFNFIPLEIGKHEILLENQNTGLPQMNYTRLVSHGDVFGAYYEQDEHYTNWIEITEIDMNTKTVKAEFDVRFKIGESYEQSGFPEFVRFRNGQFEVRIYN